MDFFEQTGVMALGSRLRQLSDRITKDSAKTYQLQGLEFEPRWFPVFFVLSREGATPVSVLAEKIGQSHPSVSQISRQMKKQGLIRKRPSESDGRQSVLELTEKGHQLLEPMEELYRHVESGVVDLLAETDHHIWQAINDLEKALDRKDLFTRVRDIKREFDAGQVAIVPFTSQYRDDFRNINIQWIETYFKMEKEDYKVLDDPENYILQPGGAILMGLYKGQAVGTCALVRRGADTFELAKMGVLPVARGKQIGWQLGLAAIEKARELGARRVYLESNTSLTPALKLYYKLGFQRIIGAPSPYERSDIQMELFL
ncbi:bifunctional helix-turn-helix transcriptional regulator/GNAT family N-acetyltransferase [Flavilitoribacter nigricans]|uniref:MarR family transcriptional regulator n=1 Tax=Flavilitoribacter nigricans (strain ATCC 23147 / DSM 23189 / NBRC 102662 / NCIMB 1420 / SS-2) TaxID=1122177 RepID=A0A2D0N8Y6_FLAN2|nr:bifunctional helix-turn-helix transcriptional regulator/GNAT family N-acetyltransferase [Flavilitoribacter nigricans]PHN04974.1 MarR family transcriptional regulator [Flavilitoribacter nigricans DSM 23189 = NBRC 102662]